MFTMHVRILPFGVLKESLGSAPFALDLPGGSTVAELLARLGYRGSVHLRHLLGAVVTGGPQPSLLEVLGVSDRVLVVGEGRLRGDFPSLGLTQEQVLAAAISHAAEGPAHAA